MLTNIDFHRLRVAVTGGTSGLGLALVRQLAAQGA
ncbi:MAG: SDR family NAD(P)-dependent oxidoreductase, partial [Mesorhizobium sp.]